MGAVSASSLHPPGREKGREEHLPISQVGKLRQEALRLCSSVRCPGLSPTMSRPSSPLSQPHEPLPLPRASVFQPGEADLEKVLLPLFASVCTVCSLSFPAWLCGLPDPSGPGTGGSLTLTEGLLSAVVLHWGRDSGRFFDPRSRCQCMCPRECFKGGSRDPTESQRVCHQPQQGQEPVHQPGRGAVTQAHCQRGQSGFVLGGALWPQGGHIVWLCPL